MTQRRDFLKTGLLPFGAICLSPLFSAGALSVAPITAGEPFTSGSPVTSGAHFTSSPSASPSGPSPLSSRLKTLTRNTGWTLVSEIRVRFKTFHCQGMVKIGNDFWVSSVEIVTTPEGTQSRSNGAGHLFKIDGSGNLLSDIAIGEGAIYHPSGIDFDGSHIWIAAAEYRPDSQSIIYQFDPENQLLREVFRWQDHIGGVARNKDSNTLHGISWGSRRFYQWQLSEKGLPRGAFQIPNDTFTPYKSPSNSATLNHSFYIDYQDNQYLGGQEMLYTGLTSYKNSRGDKFALGGLEIVDLDKGHAVHQVPLQLWSPVSGAVMTQNPSFFELSEEGKIRAYFMPDDNESIIYIYEA